MSTLTPFSTLGTNTYAWRARVTCSVPPEGGTPLGTVSSGSDAVISEYDFTAGEKRFYRIRVSDDAGNF